MKRFAAGLTVLLFTLGATEVFAVITEQRYATITGTASAPSVGECTEGYAKLCPRVVALAWWLPAPWLASCPANLLSPAWAPPSFR
jgi:hypothetical protein